MRARRSALALILALAMGLSACASDDDGDGQGATSDTTGGAPTAEENDINATDRDDLADGGTLRWPINEMPPNFNYHQLDGTLRDNSDVVSALMPGTFNFDAGAQPEIYEDYVTSAEITATEPKQVVTYKINSKATWDDGKPITWADFEAQWKAVGGISEEYKVSSTQGYDKMESVAKGGDDRDVVVTFKEPYADWQGLFNPLYPASTNSDPAVFNDGWKEKPLVTAGPFKFESLDKTAQTITLARNDKWWGRPAKLDRIIYRVIDADAQIDSLANGEIDFIDVGPDAAKLARAKTISGVTLRKAGGPNFRHITINGTSEVLKDVKVRKALGMAIDRQTIANALLGPLEVEAKPLNNHIFMVNQKGYQDNAGDLAKPDVEGAKTLLDEAGWKLEGATRKKNGKELVVRFVIPSQVASSKQEAELVQTMLAGVGAKLNVETVPSDEFFEEYVNKGNFDYTVFSWIGTPFPISSSKSIYALPQGDDIQQNYARVGSAELDALFDKATATFDFDDAAKLANEIDTMIWEEVHSLTLYQRPEIVAVKTEFGNYGAFGFASKRYEDMGLKK